MPIWPMHNVMPADCYHGGAQQRYRFVLDLAGSGPSLMQACELALERFRAR